MAEEPRLLFVGRDGELEEDVTDLLGDDFKAYKSSEDNYKALELFVKQAKHDALEKARQAVVKVPNEARQPGSVEQASQSVDLKLQDLKQSADQV